MKKQSVPVSAIEEAHEALVVEYADLLEKYAALERKYDAVLGITMPSAPMTVHVQPAYQYAEGECRPVYINGSCPICGWTRDGKNLDPHPVA